MSDKTPQWPGVDGKPGVSFGPRPAATEQTGVNPAVKDQGKSAEATQVVKPSAKGPAPQAKPQAQQTAPATTKIAAPAKPNQPQPATQQSGPATTRVAAKPADTKAPVWATPPAKPQPNTPAGSAAQAEAAKPVDGKSAADQLKSVGVSRRTRKARLRLSRVDPWSVLKTSFLFSIAFGVMLVVSAAVLWSVIQGSGALDAVNSTMTQLVGDSSTTFNVENYINAGRVIGFATVLAAIDVVLLTAVATLFAFLYNLAAAVIGGLEVTLAED